MPTAKTLGGPLKSSTRRVIITDPEIVPTRGMSEPRKAMKASNAEYFTGNPNSGKIRVSTMNDRTPLAKASEPWPMT